MPDINMCPSTVCSVRRLCERNWDSLIHKPDRTFEAQKWVPLKDHLGVGYDEDSTPDECAWFLSLSIEQMMEKGIVWRKFDRAS